MSVKWLFTGLFNINDTICELEFVSVWIAVLISEEKRTMWHLPKHITLISVHGVHTQKETGHVGPPGRPLVSNPGTSV